MKNKYVKTFNKSVTIGFIVMLIAFTYLMVQLHFTTQHYSLSTEIAEVFELEKAPETKYIGKGSTFKIGNYRYYEIKVDDKNYFIQTNESGYHVVQYIDVTDDKENVINQYNIVLD
jgi:hypothetical protein